MTEESKPEDLGFVKGKHPAAWKLLIYGPPGCGKSTWATHAPDPVFIDLENGLSRIDCAKTPEVVVSLDSLKHWLRQALLSTHKTVVIDSIDALERMLAVRALAAFDKSKRLRTIEEVPYGKGGDLLAAEWQEYVSIFDVMMKHGKNILLIAHQQILNFKNPSGEDYNYFGPNVHKKSAPIITAHMDGVFFVRYEANVREKESSDQHIATTTGRRIVHTSEGGAWVAKNRFGLEETVELGPEIFKQII